MIDWLVAAGFVGIVMGIAACFTLVVIALVCWIYDRYHTWRYPPVVHNRAKCPLCQEYARWFAADQAEGE